MPIDKIIPRFLVSDKDERLLKEGAMTDALNVTISEDGDGTEGVLKNVKGTDAASAVSGSELTDGNAVTVIGQVSDSQRGFIYFFVSDDSVTGTADAIYQYDTSAHTYKEVLKGSFLKFSSTKPIRADLLNFQHPGRSIETLLYFTDNAQQPRKINVDRAIDDGDYNNFTADELDYAIHCIKAAPSTPPTFRFDREPTVTTNNLKENLFQFACQIVYKDGEESAIGSYSKLAIPRPSVYGGLEVPGYGMPDYVDNVCIVSPNIDQDLPDLQSIRILGKRTNEGAFFVIDEFDPKEDIVREINGTQTTIYSSDTGEYRFYNDRLGAPVDPNVVNKLYDNVPNRAEGLAIIDNRLMFSNYREGYANVDMESGTTLDVQYSSVGTTPDSLILSSEYDSVITESGTINISIDPTQAADITSGGTIPAGTRVSFSFVFKPTISTSAVSGRVLSIPAVEEDQGVNILDSGYLEASSFDFGAPTTTDRTFSLDYRTPIDLTTTQFADQIQGLIEDKSVKLRYDVNSGSLIGTDGVPSTTITNATFDITFKFGEVTSSDNDVITLKPRIVGIKVVGIEYQNPYVFSPDPDQVFGQDGDAQSEVTYTVTGDYISDEIATMDESDVKRTFKSGALHNFGVVFYDKYNRSGFVNEIGSVFVDHIAERSSNYGPASIKIVNGWTSPTWAESYQIVYSGSSIENVTQYTVGGAFVKVDSSNNVDTKSKQLYVSLKTLDIYRDQKEVLRDYSFTKGDKLRVINYTATDGTKVYPTGSGGDVDGNVIEFDVVGVKILANDEDNPIKGSTHADWEAGTFLVLEAPNIVATSDLTTSSDVNKYVGFDWYHIGDTDYNSTVESDDLNYWYQNCLVEIVTPKKSTSETIYYEIGERFSADSAVKDIVLDGGDVYYRPVSCKSVIYASNEWEYDDVKDWEYQVQFLEDFSVSDLFSSRDWDRGRAHTKYDKADSITYINGITYSDKYVLGSEALPLSSFNTSLANFSTAELKYGALRFIGNYNNDMVAIQENKLSLIPVNKNIIEYSGGSSNVAIATDVLGAPRYSSGDYGCGTHSEAVLIQDNTVYFADESRQAVCALTGGQLVPISEKGMSSFFEDFFASGATSYVSGYDPRDNTYYITRKGSNEDTVGYDAGRGVWQSRYSFIPDVYASQDNMLYSAKYKDSSPDTIFYKHDDDLNHNSFYGTNYTSFVKVVSKMSPSRVKVFNAISYEGDSNRWEMSTKATTNLGQTSGVIHDSAGSDLPKFQEKEGSYYAAMPKDESVKYVYAGTFTSATANVATVTNIARLDRLPFLLSKTQLHYLNDGNYNAVTAIGSNSVVDSFDVANGTITTLGNISGPADGDKLYFKVTTDGDDMRGHFMNITLTLSTVQSSQQELYCINTHITDSKAHHPLGQ